MPQSKNWQPFSIKGQKINVVGFAAHIHSPLHILSRMYILQPLENIEIIFSSEAVQNSWWAGLGLWPNTLPTTGLKQYNKLCDYMDECHNYNTEQKTIDTKENILYDTSYIKFEKKQNSSIVIEA